MKKIVLKRVTWHDRPCIAMVFAYDKELLAIAMKIPGVRYSGTNKFWCVDDSQRNISQIMDAFKGIAEIDHPGIELNDIQPEPGNTATRQIENLPDGDNQGNRVIRQVENDPVEDDPENNDFDDAKTESTTEKGKHHLSPVELRTDQSSKRLIIRFTGFYDQSWIDELKSYGRLRYDKTRKEFLLPLVQNTIDSLSDYFIERGIEVRVKKEKPGKEIIELRKTFGEEIRSRVLSDEAGSAIEFLKNYLEENRYSGRTIETYSASLELFFKYFNGKDPDEVTMDDLSGFMNDVIIKNDFSTSYQNQVVSAIKLYYEIAGKGRINPINLQRPRRGRILPKVLSKEEVGRILNSGRNLKHKFLLWIIYSCGLRRSEVTNIKLDDLDRKRGIIHIREGKGGIDRIVPVSDKVWNKLDEYIRSYQPGQYLFEGQEGGRYSVESVYNVFKQALRRSGIRKDVGVHSLRHSYATHLHENGLDIRYIQELLGHKSTRTTEIYTHVSRRNLIAVRSPIEDLDIK